MGTPVGACVCARVSVLCAWCACVYTRLCVYTQRILPRGLSVLGQAAMGMRTRAGSGQ